jgi:D-alanyl-D-alanine carboxypeptidase/Putative peptidoglycan binding domain
MTETLSQPTPDEIPLPPEGVADNGAPEDEPPPRAGDAQDRGWGAAPAPASVIAPTTVGPVTVWVHRDVVPLVRAGMARMVAVGYQPRAGECWGYAPRRIRPSAGKTEAEMPWSNHAWGLAVDINAPANPMGSTLVTDMSPGAVAAFTDLGFRWGGTFQSRPDAMHFEYMGTPQAARATASQLGGGATPSPLGTGTQGGTGRLIVDVSLPPLQQGATGTHVKSVQALLNAKAGAGLTVDGDFGDRTDAAVRAWQSGTGLGVDGIVGPNTWKVLLERP